MFFSLFVLSLGVTWALIQPPYGISDEPAHTVKALATSDGQLQGPQTVGQFGYSAMEFQVPSAYSSLWHFTCYSGDVNTTPDCAPQFPTGADRIYISSTAAEYPPVYYATVGIFGWISPGQQGLFLMRLVTVILVTILIVLAGHLFVQFGYARQLATLLICATPTVFSFSGSVNAFSPEVAASILYWTSGIFLLQSPNRKSKNLIASIYIGAIAFGVMRPASFLWILISMSVIFIVSVNVKELPFLFGKKNTNMLHVLSASGIACILSVCWYFLGMTVRNLGGGSPAGGELFDNILVSFQRTPQYLQQIFGFFGWTTFYAPILVVILFTTSLLLSFLVNLRYNRREIVGLSCLVSFISFGPAILEGARAASSGWGFQGRYLIPVAIGIPIVLALGGINNRRSLLLSNIIAIPVVLGHLIALNHVAKRFTVGLSGPSFWPSHIKWSGLGGQLAIQISFTLTLCFGVAFIISQLCNDSEQETNASISSNKNISALEKHQ